MYSNEFSTETTSKKIENNSASKDAQINEPYLFTNENYSNQFFSELRNLFVTNKMTDVLLICGEKPLSNGESANENDESRLTIPCHKLVLSAFSPYFKAMFSSDLMENRTNKVYMSSTDSKTLHEIVNYAYCGSIYINVNNVQNVFVLASLLQVNDLLNACCSFIESNLDLNNCIEVYSFSKHHMCDYLIDKSREFLNRNFNEITKTAEFLEIDDFNLMNEILSSDDLDVSEEEMVLAALIKWLEYDYDKRSAYFEHLFLSSIRIGLCDVAYLVDFSIKYKHLLDLNPKSNALIKMYTKINEPNEKNSASVIINEECSSSSQNVKQKTSRMGMIKALKCFLFIGGNCESADGSYVNCYNPFNGEKYFLSINFLNKSKYFTKGYFHVEYPGVCITSSNQIYVAGGVYVFHKYKTYNEFSKGSSKFNQAAQNDPTESCVDELSSFSNESDNLRDGEEMLSKEMFEYDNAQNSWIKKANMLFAKANFSLCQMNNRVYSFGGVSTGQIPLDIVEYYDIGENKWIYVGSMPSPFVAGTVVMYQDKFYILGGRNGVDRHDSCYVFKPETCEWTEITKMNIGRFNFGACVFNDKLYVFGGQRYNESGAHFFTREALDSVEVYDFKSKVWTTSLKMPAPLYNTGVCVYDESNKSIYLCGTTECQYGGNSIFGFMFTSAFRLDFVNDINNKTKLKWTIVEHDVSEIKAYYRCVCARVNTRKLYKITHAGEAHLRE